MVTFILLKFIGELGSEKKIASKLSLVAMAAPFQFDALFTQILGFLIFFSINEVFKTRANC